MNTGYYVSVMEGPKYALLAGPYATHDEALANKQDVMNKAVELDPKAWFYAFGTASIVSEKPLPQGKLNSYLVTEQT